MLGVNASEAPRTFLGTYMLAASAAFLIPSLATRGKTVSGGQANLAFYGATRGLYLGVLTAAVLAGNVNFNQRYQAFTTGILLGSVAGVTGGYLFSGGGRVTAGQARTMAVTGDFGLGLGFGAGFLLDFDGSDKTPDQRARRMGAMGLAGAAVGLTGGYLLGRERDNTWGDGEVMRAAGLLGAWSGFTVANQFQTSMKPGIALVMAGGLAGLGVGDRLVVDTDFTLGQSVLVDLAALTGALAAAGVLYLFSPVDWSERPFVLASALGGMAGYGLAYWALRDEAAEGPVSLGLSRAAAQHRVSLLPLVGGSGQRGLSLLASF
jgi:hypothetical protein